jgi:hypothetical protein
MRPRFLLALALACMALAGHVGASQVQVESLASVSAAAWRIEAMSPLGVGYDFLLERARAEGILFAPAPLADPRSADFWSTFSTPPPGSDEGRLDRSELG